MQPATTLSDKERRRLFERTGVAEHVPTDEAAVLIGRQPQTLRRWASEGSGPIRPRRVNGRLMWSVDDIRAALKVGV
jgi:hypothetical protein